MKGLGIIFEKKLVSERPCKVEGCGSHIFLDDEKGWLCIKKRHPQGEYGSK